VGLTEKELCGILSGGVILIGSLLGRVSPATADDEVQALAESWRRRFAEAMGATICEDLRALLPDEPNRCGPLLRRGVGLLLDVLKDHLTEAPHTLP
jgi:hypothetical protein